jgi:hypothetical protein
LLNAAIIDSTCRLIRRAAYQALPYCGRAEFLGYMLGVRRVGVTTVAAAFQRQALIT